MATNRVSQFLKLLLLLQVFMATARKPTTEEENLGTTWAVLIAGSYGYYNYRHQADVCHAYQVLKRGGLEDEHIIVFMYDDIASNPWNAILGEIYNSPGGEDVYAGVPKDYTRENMTISNFVNVLLGRKELVLGGSGKVLDSGKDDRVFIYYSGHGSRGSIQFLLGPPIYADDFIGILTRMFNAEMYKEMVVYIEACHSGSMFQDLSPNLNIYATTASNADEASYACYCHAYDGYPCLGDLYSVSWMEDSDSSNRGEETLAQQFEKVRDRTSVGGTCMLGSHVMEYGNLSTHDEKLSLYQGFNPATRGNNITATASVGSYISVDQESSGMFCMWKRYKMETRPAEKEKILKEIKSIELRRQHLEGIINSIGSFLFGPKSSSVLNHVRQSGEGSLVDDLHCLKTSTKVFEKYCGPLTDRFRVRKHSGAFANICNAGVSPDALEKACKVICNGQIGG